jgi:MFS transporter, PPP family, 3-phenylpropionic acid transporter
MHAHSALSVHSRLASAQFAVFVGLGIYLPFWPLWLEARGFDEKDIGLLIAGPSAFRILLIPLVAAIAERTGAHRGTAIGLIALSIGAILAAPLATSFATMLAILVAFYGAFALVFLLLDQLALSVGPTHGVSYGRVRLFGSLGFLAATILGGEFLKGGPSERIHAALAGSLLVALIALLFLPRATPPVARTADVPLARVPLPYRALLALAVAYGLIQASHGAFYVGSSLVWHDHGFDEDTIGQLWALGVAAEIACFAYGASLFRYGTYRWLVLGGAVAIVRWWCHPYGETLWIAAALQLLHGFTFGLTHLAGLQLLRSMAPPSRGTSAQGILYMIGGLSGAIAMAASGDVMEIDSTLAFHAMSVVALGGVVVALLAKRTIDRARVAQAATSPAPAPGA